MQCSLQQRAIYPPILFRAQRLYELLFTILNSNPVIVPIRIPGSLHWSHTFGNNFQRGGIAEVYFHTDSIMYYYASISESICTRNHGLEIQ